MVIFTRTFDFLSWLLPRTNDFPRAHRNTFTRVHPRPVSEGIPFLGFIVYPNHRRLKRRKGVYFGRKLRRLVDACARGQISFEAMDASVQGWINHVRYGNTIGLRKAMFHSIPLIKERQL